MSIEKETQEVLNIANRIDKCLSLYIYIHNDIFSSSLRKLLPIPLFFKKIDYHSHFKSLQGLQDELLLTLNELKDLKHHFKEDTYESVFINVGLNFITALEETITSLNYICNKMTKRIDGNFKYPYKDYLEDTNGYEVFIKKYMSYARELTDAHYKLVNKGVAND